MFSGSLRLRGYVDAQDKSGEWISGYAENYYVFLDGELVNIIEASISPANLPSRGPTNHTPLYFVSAQSANPEIIFNTNAVRAASPFRDYVNEYGEMVLLTGVEITKKSEFTGRAIECDGGKEITFDESGNPQTDSTSINIAEYTNISSK